jgi:lipopolysaccharide export system protein LptA
MNRIVPVLTGLLICVFPSAAEAQADACWLNPSTHRLDVRMEEGSRVAYTIYPVVTCSGGARITAEEGTLYESRGEVHLIGNVRFTDPDRSLTSDQAIYTSGDGRLHATGNVVFSDRVDGMTVTGPELDYYRATPTRPESHAIARQRPHLTMQPRPRPGAEQRPGGGEPIQVDADEMTMFGNDRFTAIGRVEIRRSDFQAFSSRAEMDQVQEQIELRGNSRVHSEQFDLAGDWIDMSMPGDRLERVVAQHDAWLVGDDLRVDAPDIQLFFTDDELQRLVARTRGDTDDARPIASARGFRLEADSLDAIMPAQQLERVIAVGTARGETVDTLALPAGRLAQPLPAGELASGEVDWIVGDTVTGFFARVEPVVAEEPDDMSITDEEPTDRPEVRMERIIAQGTARSLYRIRNEREGAQTRPGLNYLIGEIIELTFAEGELEVADVRGLSRGVYLDPEPAAETGEPDEPDEEETPDAEPVTAPDTTPLSSTGNSRLARWR